MKKNKRDLFIEQTAILMSKQGYHGTGLSEILKACNAQRGSLYHYFPNGKEELACATITHHVAELIQELTGLFDQLSGDIAEDIYQMILLVAIEADSEQGVSPRNGFMLMASNAASSNETIKESCMEAFGQIHAFHTARFLMDKAITEPMAIQISTMLMLSLHGAMMGTKLMQNGDLFRAIADPMRQMVRFAQEGKTFT